MYARTVAVLLMTLSGVAAASTAPTTPPSTTATTPYNVVLIVLDDLGTEKLSCYGTSPSLIYPSTPNIDSLLTGGTRFDRAYVEPVCSPSRSCFMTGQYPFRTGVLNQIGSDVSTNVCGMGTSAMNLAFTLPASAPSGSPYVYMWLPEHLRTLAAPFATGAFGKWHLSTDDTSNYCHPISCGFDLFNGHLGNNENQVPPHNGHFGWDRVTSKRQPGGLCQTIVPPAPIVTSWDARETRIAAASWILRQVTNNKKYFAYVAFNPPHQSFQVPPLDGSPVCASPGVPAVPPSNGISAQTWTDLCNAGLTTPGQAVPGVGACFTSPTTQTDYDNARLVERAMIEALDWEIGQLLAGINLSDTVVIVCGDNGTPDGVLDATGAPDCYGSYPYPPAHAKRSLYDLGTRVPLIIHHPAGASPALSHELVHAVDMWNTIAEIAGGAAAVDPSLDSLSLAPYLDGTGPAARTNAYCEVADKNGWIWGVPPGSSPPAQWINIDPPAPGSGFTECAPSLKRAVVMRDPATTHYFKLIQHTQLAFTFPAPCPATYTVPYSCPSLPSFCSTLSPQPDEELYDLDRDPNELSNLIDSSTLCSLRDSLRAIAQGYTGP